MPALILSAFYSKKRTKVKKNSNSDSKTLIVFYLKTWNDIVWRSSLRYVDIIVWLSCGVCTARPPIHRVHIPGLSRDKASYSVFKVVCGPSSITRLRRNHGLVWAADRLA